MAKKIEIVQPLDLDKLLGKPRNRVARVGVELEGCWNKLPGGTRLERDSSVFHDNPPAGYRSGELPLGPMQPAQLTRAMNRYYPQMVDETCGLHVHMSFETVYQYNLLMDSPVYQETMVEYLIRWAKAEGFGPTHHIWPRLKGESEYCQKKFWPDAQAQMSRKDWDKTRDGHRYTIIHYCWSRNGTVECRVLPMMETAAQAIRAVKTVIDVTNAYLIAAGKEKVKAKEVLKNVRGTTVKLELRKGDIYEESFEN